MKINISKYPITTYKKSNMPCPKNDTNLSVPSFEAKYPHSQIAFYGLVKPNSRILTNEMYENAQKYLKTESEKIMNKFKKDYGEALPRENLSLNDFNLEKLNGIQKGIKVFEGLSMKDIKFLCYKPRVIMTKRDCPNVCSFCSVDAAPRKNNKNPNEISQMLQEDLSSFASGFKELDKRLGFKAINIPFGQEITLFRDNDCMEMEILDKLGKPHDFIDMHKLIWDSTGEVGLCDTSGWSPKSIKHQKRAEKIVEYLKTHPEQFSQINISVNPFHGLNEKRLEYLGLNNEVGAQKMRDLYTDRMANTIFTFTPVVDKNNFHIITRAFNEDVEKHFSTSKGHSTKDLQEIATEISRKLVKLYLKDYNGEKKYIKNPAQIKEKMDIVNKNLFDIHSFILPIGRAKNLFKKSAIETLKNELSTNPINLALDLDADNFYKMIDANGKVYVSEKFGFYVVPTDIRLNFENKTKSTPPIAELTDKIKITRRMIDEFYN